MARAVDATLGGRDRAVATALRRRAANPWHPRHDIARRLQRRYFLGVSSTLCPLGLGAGRLQKQADSDVGRVKKQAFRGARLLLLGRYAGPGLFWLLHHA